MATIDTVHAERAFARSDDRTRVLTWPNALAGFVLLIWLMPIRTYRLPAALPFNLELYRIAIVALVGAFVLALLMGKARLSAGGVGVPLALFVGFAIASQFANLSALDPKGGESNALTSLLQLMSFVLVLVLICSTIGSRGDAERIVKAFVVGALLVSLAALVESRFNYNFFDHLDRWIPFLDHDARYEVSTRRGVPRVRSSAQHPIALAAALMLAVPLAIYLTSRARTSLRRALWGGAGVLVALGAMVPVARTAVVMAMVMLVLAVLFRGAKIWRYWPVFVVALAVLHLVRPGVMGAMYKSFFPENGILSEASGRSGLPGSGRLADIKPGVELWESSPALGIGRGNPLIGGRAADDPVRGVIFDNQYMGFLVTLGVLGIVTFAWFLGSTLLKLVRSARERIGPTGDLIFACTLGVAAFTVAMYFFDAFSFVQVTILFFVVAGLGLRSLAFPDEPDRGSPSSV